MPTVGKLMHESSFKCKGTTVSTARKWKTDTAKEDGEQFERRGPTNRGCRLAGYIKERGRKRGNNNNLYVIGEEDSENVEEALDDDGDLLALWLLKDSE